ncbi:MAG: hypothetical protein H2174_00950 [Vampirovibrio sp.]|nr:hypothetical protein [Vampirovibrio sp.]
MMMMMTGFSAIPQSTTTALRAMPRKTSVDEAEAVEEKEEITEPKTANSASVNTPPPATGKNVVIPVLAGAGTALAGGIGAGQGFWEYAPNTGTMSEADALAKVKGDSTLEATAKKELEVLKEKKIDGFLDDQDEMAKQLKEPTYSAADRKKIKEDVTKPEELKQLKALLFNQEKQLAVYDEMTKDQKPLLKEKLYFDKIYDLIDAEFDTTAKFLLEDQHNDYMQLLQEEVELNEQLANTKLAFHGTLDADSKKTISQELTRLGTEIFNIQQAKVMPSELKAFEQAQIQANRLIALHKDQSLDKEVIDLLESCILQILKAQGLSVETVEIAKKGIKKAISDIEAYDKLDLKDTPSVQKLTKESLKTATQKVEGFMKWGYAKADDLKSIGGEELVKHANSSKIALGAGALVAGAGVGTLTYFLLNKPKPTPQTDS